MSMIGAALALQPSVAQNMTGMEIDLPADLAEARPAELPLIGLRPEPVVRQRIPDERLGNAVRPQAHNCIRQRQRKDRRIHALLRLRRDATGIVTQTSAHLCSAPTVALRQRKKRIPGHLFRWKIPVHPFRRSLRKLPMLRRHAQIFLTQANVKLHKHPPISVDASL